MGLSRRKHGFEPRWDHHKQYQWVTVNFVAHFLLRKNRFPTVFPTFSWEVGGYSSGLLPGKKTPMNTPSLNFDISTFSAWCQYCPGFNDAPRHPLNSR
jgi:hypothetical protein